MIESEKGNLRAEIIGKIEGRVVTVQNMEGREVIGTQILQRLEEH